MLGEASLSPSTIHTMLKRIMLRACGGAKHSVKEKPLWRLYLMYMRGRSVTEKPIIFRGDMVRAILDGRMHQTRWPMSPQPPDGATLVSILDGMALFHRSSKKCNSHMLDWWATPRYAVGDILWVREAHEICDYEGDSAAIWYIAGDNTDDAATWLDVPPQDIGKVVAWVDDKRKRESVRPPIHMPRWCARLFLRVTEIRAQRLQDINEEDAIAEGVERFANGLLPSGYGIYDRDLMANGQPGMLTRSPIKSFESLWASIHGPDAWAQNPWVWAYTFERAGEEA